MSCHKIVFDANEDLNQAIEIHHPPEAIEEVKVEVMQPFGENAYTQTMDGLFIKLFHCTQCDQVFLTDPREEK